LFDEPLSNLDAKLRTELRVEIKRLHHKLQNTMIYVTHDQIEAMTLANRIAIMREGLILQLDNPKTIYNFPVNKYVAEFIGSPSMNFIEGQLENSNFEFDVLSFNLDGYSFKEKNNSTSKVWLGVRPENIIINETDKTMPVNFNVVVEVVEPMGADTLVWSSLNGKEIRFIVEGNKTINIGDKLSVGFNPAHISIFDFDTENRL
jgi:multiple sugar transport system ATP-binding protein